jgi:hypothetical protein
MRRAGEAAEDRGSIMTVTLLVSGCGGVQTEQEIVRGGATARSDDNGALEVLSSSGTVLARFPAGRWIRWDWVSR